MKAPRPAHLRTAASRLRAKAASRRQGVYVGPGVSFGPGVIVRVAEGGRLHVGLGVEIGADTELVVMPGASVVIDNGAFLGRLCVVAAHESVYIGADTMAAEMVSIRDHDHDPSTAPKSGTYLTAPVYIGREVWLGAKSSVLRGATIPDGCVIGAHSLVNKPLEGRCLAAGVPARKIRDLD